MTTAALRATEKRWEAKARFRKARWAYWRRRPKQTEETIRLRRKWWDKYLEAERVLHRVRASIDKQTPKSTRALSVAWAASKVGIHESPAGSNRGPQIDQWQRRFGFLAAPWCGIFVGNALLAAGVKGVTSRIASVGAIQQDAEAHRGCFYGWTPGSVQGALRGDAVVLFSFGVHVELVVSVNSDGSVNTIGGNTSATPGSDNQSDGGCVARHTRSVSEIHGVAHIRYP
jgi:hypothetical protein